MPFNIILHGNFLKFSLDATEHIFVFQTSSILVMNCFVFFWFTKLVYAHSTGMIARIEHKVKLSKFHVNLRILSISLVK